MTGPRYFFSYLSSMVSSYNTKIQIFKKNILGFRGDDPITTPNPASVYIN